MVNFLAGKKLILKISLMVKLAQEYDKLFKLVALVFINALMRVSGIPPGIVRIEYPEVFTEETCRGIMDFPVLSILGFYIIFEFHSTPLDESKLLRNFQYLANFRARVDAPVTLHIISIEKVKKSKRKVKITPEWDFEPEFIFLIDFDGEEILNTIKYKIEHELSLTDIDAYLLAVLPFTQHEMSTVELVEHLCYYVNEIKLSEVYKYIIKLSQILWVKALIKDESLRKELMDVIKMRNTFLQNYERNLVESAVDSVQENTAVILMNGGVSHDLILKATGVDVDKL